ncbi:hypothetical protein CYY_002430 [Polysphondylium violaceum]|uniref:Sulfhydryl oxidase n=1 Tax=Polysphondylium violaceum TaxID=133409 RepID=A0A8J4Q069_9MYCE|nr:hypothetical protein CYY_002430 [Polysphondylium violaceum]
MGLGSKIESIRKEAASSTKSGGDSGGSSSSNVSAFSGNLFSKEEAEDCGTCTLLGVTDKKNQMFAMISETSPPIDMNESHQFWEPMPPPPDFIELGNSGWTLLHTMAAYYPTHPNESKKQEMKEFLHSFSKVYPCNVCAKDFQDILHTTPPELSSQDDFAQWLCRAHNRVNVHLGKPKFDCSLVSSRWKRDSPAKH